MFYYYKLIVRTKNKAEYINLMNTLLPRGYYWPGSRGFIPPGAQWDDVLEKDICVFIQKDRKELKYSLTSFCNRMGLKYISYDDYMKRDYRQRIPGEENLTAELIKAIKLWNTTRIA